jgi:hypothetical protein
MSKIFQTRAQPAEVNIDWWRQLPQPESKAFTAPGAFHSRSYGIDMASVPNSKMVVFGLPKSGNVWLVSLLRDYLGLKYVDPFVETDKSGVGMSHLPFSETIGNRTDILHGIYLQRDIRDVVVSYFHHLQRDDWRAGFPHYHCNNIHDFYFEWFLPRVTIFLDIDHHAKIYTALGLPIVRYETLYSAPAAEFERLLRRLGFRIDQEKIAGVVAANDLSVLKVSGKKMETGVPAAHFRRGGHGNFVNELPVTVLRHINARFKPLLEDWGYEL